MRSIIVWECMWFLIRDNVHQWVCFLYRSLAASVGFVTMVAEETVFCCVACGHVLQQLPSSFLSRSAAMSQHWPSFPAPPLPSEGAHQHQAGCFCPPLSSCTRCCRRPKIVAGSSCCGSSSETALSKRCSGSVLSRCRLVG